MHAQNQAPPPRCFCGRPVPAGSLCGCCCANHDVERPAPVLSAAEAATVARFDAAEPAPESYTGGAA